MFPPKLLPAVALVATLAIAPTHAGEAQLLRRFDAPEAVQGVAVGHAAFYAIANSAIGKYDKATGKRLGGWQADESTTLRHLNAGVVRDGRLYCAHSNFPQWPETSSVEIFDTETLQHVQSHSFGLYEGSLTWVDWRDDEAEKGDGGAWWACFAHYSERVNDNPRALPHTYTSLVKFDAQWRRLAGWVFPPEVLERLAPHSSSGGGWAPGAGASGGLIAATGHDRPEVYLLALPRSGATLRLVETVSVPITGQAIAWDPADPGVLYGIDRPRQQVVVSRVTLPKSAPNLEPRTK